MSDVTRDELRVVWRQLAQRNDWMLATDEDCLLDAAATEYAGLTGNLSPSKQAQVAVQRAYGALLYNGLQQREERAAEELWLAFVRLSLKSGLPRPEAEELAQESIARVCEKLHTLRAPEGLIFWALRIFHTVKRERRESAEATELPLESGDDPAANFDASVPTDPTDLQEQVEQRLIGAAVEALLRRKLPNALEREVLVRIVMLADKPRDVARDLGLPLYRTRQAKSLALKRLRNDPEVQQLLADLLGDTPQPPSIGADDDDA